MLKHPLNVSRTQVPLQEAQDNEIVNPRITILEESSQHVIFGFSTKLEAHQVLYDPYILFMAVVCASFILSLLAIDGLHLLLKAHLVHQLLHLALIVALVPAIGGSWRQRQVVVRID